MKKEVYEFESLSTREGFNRSLSHFKAVSALLDDFEDKDNLGDILNDLIAENEIEPNQIIAIVYALLVDKYGYNYRSFNIEKTITDLSKFADEFIQWKAVDLVLCYFHPELGVLIINPKNKEHWASLDQLKKDELITIYAGAFNEKVDQKVLETAIDKTIDTIKEKKFKTPATLVKGKFTYKPRTAPAPPQPPKTTSSKYKERAKKYSAAAKQTETVEEEAAPKPEEKPAPQLSRKVKITPMYSVPVTNELFHNGNVEAWKRIINSYKAKNPGNEVYIFYEGEKINDINTLFKWGKVKHGSSILFAVAGEEIRDIAKLQRYLKQGASPKFEDFLKFPVNHILNLF